MVSITIFKDEYLMHPFVQWNPVIKNGYQGDMSKCPYYRGVRIKAGSQIKSHMFYRLKDQGRHFFTATKRFYCTLAVTSFFCNCNGNWNCNK